MNKIFADADVGKKNIVSGVVLFLLLGVLVGIPLTIDFFGGSILSDPQYQTWKVVHGYGVFLAFINYFLGTGIDRLEMPRGQKEIVSWSFLAAGITGGVIRMTLVLMAALDDFGVYASLAETLFFILGTVILVRGQIRERPGHLLEGGAQANYSRTR